MTRIVANGLILRNDTPLIGAGFVDLTAATSTLVAAANRYRSELNIINDSDTTVYLALGTTAVGSQGIRLNSGGGTYSTSVYTGAVNAIHNGVGVKRVVVTDL